MRTLYIYQYAGARNIVVCGHWYYRAIYLVHRLSAIYVSSYCYICVLIVVYLWCDDTGACSRRARILTYAIRTHRAYVSIRVLILVPVVDEHVC
jgi:hypothetical protein